MRILVYPHVMTIGGSQLNAIELAAAVRDRGHGVTVIGGPGPLQTRVSELGLDFVELPPPGRRPSPATARHIRGLIRRLDVDIVHGYEWPPSLEALIACRGTSATPVSTVLSMSVAPFIPDGLPILVGTEQIASAERGRGRTLVGLMEPPVDTALNAPDARIPLERFRAEWGLDGPGFTLVAVSRLSRQMKREGLVAACRLVDRMPRESDIRLLIVGAGPAEEELRALAAAVNRDHGRQRIILTGELEDPRCAYAAADVVLGMGGSALRGMAFGKPLIVQGEQGYWKTLTPGSLPEFLWQGWYGHGPGPDRGVARLREELEPLLHDESQRAELGAFCLSTVRNRFSLEAAAAHQESFYHRARDSGAARCWTARKLAVTGARFAAYKSGRLASRLRGGQASDDFNASPTVGDVAERGRRAETP